MRAIPGTARHFGWQPPMPAPRRRAATHVGTALGQAVRSMIEGLAAAAGRAAGAVRRWRLINRNISRLDYEVLADIGLHRSEILASVHRRVRDRALRALLVRVSGESVS